MMSAVLRLTVGCFFNIYRHQAQTTLGKKENSIPQQRRCLSVSEDESTASTLQVIAFGEAAITYDHRCDLTSVSAPQGG